MEFARDDDRRRSLDLYILAVDRGEPSEFAGLCRVRVSLVEPGAPILYDPIAFCVGRRVASAYDARSLRRVSGAVPADQKSELSIRKVADFVEALQIVRSALILLLVADELDGAELDAAMLPAVCDPP